MIRPAGAGALALACLSSSRAFVDYSTSGLENPLTHLLLAVLLLVYLDDRNGRADGDERAGEEARGGEPAGPGRGRRLFVLSLIASLCAVNRLDTLLLVTPLVGAAWLRRKS